MIKDAILAYLMEQGYGLEYGVIPQNDTDPPIRVSYHGEYIGKLHFEVHRVIWTRGLRQLDIEYINPTMFDQLDKVLERARQQTAAHSG